MLKDLFKPDWQKASAEKRLSGLATLKPENVDELSIILQLLENDSESTVRHAALQKLSDPIIVYGYSKDHNSEFTRLEARQHFIKLISNKSSITQSNVIPLLAKHPETSSLLLSHCADNTVRSSLLNEFSSSQLATMIAAVPFSDTRKQIANKLTKEDDLKTACEKLKGKDKTIEKLLRSKLEEIHKQEKLANERIELVTKLCATMDELAGKDYWHKDIKSQFLLTEQRWKGLGFEVKAEQQDRFEHAHQRVKQHIAKHEIDASYRLSQQELLESIEKTCHNIAKLELQSLCNDSESYTAAISQYHQNWTDLAESLRPSAELNERFIRAQSAARDVLDFAKHEFFSAEVTQSDSSILNKQIKTVNTSLKQLHWPKAFPDLIFIDEVKAYVADWQAQLEAKRNAYQAELDKLHKRINRLQASTKRGTVKLAQRELGVISNKVEQYSGKDRAALDKRLLKASAAVSKMSDWKDFATEPKFIELCEQMEALANSKLHPDKLAKQIKKLQESWKSLGHTQSADTHWERFKTAADAAYAPCASFFEKRHKTREKNLATREKLLTELKQLLETTEWDSYKEHKAIEKSLRDSMHQWRKIKEVDPKAGEKQWKRYNKLRDELYAKLEPVYSSNLEAKQELLAKAENLLEQDVQDKTLGKLQYLQKNWSEVGITRRKDDQKLWKKFKRTTDAIYANIQGQRKAKRAAEDEQLNAYRKLIKQMQSLAKTAGDLTALDSGFEELKAKYQNLPELPKDLPEKLITGINKDYQRASADCQKAHDRLIQKGKNQAWEVLAKKAALCSQLENLRCRGDVASEKLSKVREQMDAQVVNDKELTKHFMQRLNKLDVTDRSKYSELRRRLCIDLEILLDQSSPNQDQALRTQIQLERMQKSGLGQGGDDLKTRLKQIKLDWYCWPGAEPSVQDELDKRFQKLLRVKD